MAPLMNMPRSAADWGYGFLTDGPPRAPEGHTENHLPVGVFCVNLFLFCSNHRKSGTMRNAARDYRLFNLSEAIELLGSAMKAELRGGEGSQEEVRLSVCGAIEMLVPLKKEPHDERDRSVFQSGDVSLFVPCRKVGVGS